MGMEKDRIENGHFYNCHSVVFSCKSAICNAYECNFKCFSCLVLNKCLWAKLTCPQGPTEWGRSAVSWVCHNDGSPNNLLGRSKIHGQWQPTQAGTVVLADEMEVRSYWWLFGILDAVAAMLTLLQPWALGSSGFGCQAEKVGGRYNLRGMGNRTWKTLLPCLVLSLVNLNCKSLGCNLLIQS